MLNTIEELVQQARLDINNAPLFKLFDSGSVTPAQWKIFAAQRYILAVPFERLLQAGIEGARAVENVELETSLTSNLQDEQGRSGAYMLSEANNSHEHWRKLFYIALGLSEEGLKHATPIEAAKQYVETVECLIADANALEIAGALLVLEGTIPDEFIHLQKSRNVVFPELRPEARVFIDDHIYHDATWHYPGILKSLNRYVGTKDCNVIAVGAQKMTKVRRDFFLQVAEYMLRS